MSERCCDYGTVHLTCFSPGLHNETWLNSNRRSRFQSSFTHSFVPILVFNENNLLVEGKSRVASICCINIAAQSTTNRF